MQRLIVPLDGSQSAESALQYGKRLASHHHAQLCLVHVLKPDETLDGADAEHYLRDLATLHADDVPADIHVLRGEPADALIQFIDGGSNGMIVLSRHGHTSLRRNRADSVAMSVLRQSTIPVMLVDEEMSDPNYELDELLVPLDGSGLAASALPHAVELVGKTGRLCLVRVVTPVEDGSGLTVHHEAAAAIDDARAVLLEVATELRQEGVNVSWEIRFGDPATEIIRAAETAGVRGIVIATRGLRGQRPWIFGSVTESVIRLSSLPIVIIPPTSP